MDLTGSYALTGITLRWSTLLGNPVRTITEQDLSSWAGSLLVSPSDISWGVTVAGEPIILGHWYPMNQSWGETFAYSGVS